MHMESAMTNQQDILEQIRLERERQDRKWGVPQPNTLPEWMAILGEEYGEVCQEVLRVHFGNKDPLELVEEVVQVAAVCVAMLENLWYSKTATDLSYNVTNEYRQNLKQETETSVNQ